MIFGNLHISNWRQFREVDLTFHERLTVLTGANGCGKTTILNLLSRHFGWENHLVSTPRRQRNGLAFYSDIWTEDYLHDYKAWLEDRDRSSRVIDPPAPITSSSSEEQQIGTPFAVTIDEPENHLHPELQRTILGTFLDAFPNVQFICATHNPFIVTSVPQSHTYALGFGQDNRVRSELLSAVDRTGSSNEILRDVLGLPSASPTWVEESLKTLLADFSAKDLTPALIEELQSQLSSLGLGRYLPVTLARLAREKLGE